MVLPVIKGKQMKSLSLVLFFSSLFVACKKEDDAAIKTFIVASQKGTYTGIFGQQMTSIMVKEQASAPFRPLGQGIEGFDYQEGFEYVVLVYEVLIPDPPQDGSNVRYVLKKIISKQ